MTWNNKTTFSVRGSHLSTLKTLLICSIFGGGQCPQRLAQHLGGLEARWQHLWQALHDPSRGGQAQLRQHPPHLQQLQHQCGGVHHECGGTLRGTSTRTYAASATDNKIKFIEINISLRTNQSNEIPGNETLCKCEEPIEGFVVNWTASRTVQLPEWLATEGVIYLAANADGVIENLSLIHI